MLLQIALDDISFEDAKVLLSKVEKYVDIIELGTPFAYSNPISAIGEFKKLFPNKKILADYKILDGGGFMANLAYKDVYKRQTYFGPFYGRNGALVRNHSSPAQ